MNSAVYSSDKKTSGGIFRLALRAIGGLAIVAVFFFGTVFVLDYFYLPYPDYVRASHAKDIKIALEKYKAAKGRYPATFPSNPLTDIRKDLVGGGFIGALPSDPIYGDAVSSGYMYASGGASYGLLVHLKYATGNIPAGGVCLTGVGFAATGWWGNPPACPF
jgi:hypothetical protein